MLYAPPVVARPHKQHIALFHADALRRLSRLQVLRHNRLVRRQPVNAARRRYVQQYAPRHNPLRRRLNGMALRPLPRCNYACGNAVVHSPLPRVVRQRVYVRDALPVKHHPDELRRAAPCALALRRVGIPALAAVHHKPLNLIANVGRYVGGNRPRAAHDFAILHKRRRLPPLGGRNQI